MSTTDPSTPCHERHESHDAGCGSSPRRWWPAPSSPPASPPCSSPSSSTSRRAPSVPCRVVELSTTPSATRRCGARTSRSSTRPGRRPPRSDPKYVVPQTPTADDPRTSKTPQQARGRPPARHDVAGLRRSPSSTTSPAATTTCWTTSGYVKRVTQFKQPGACLNCHASTYPIMKQLGNGDINAGFDAMNKMPYADATKLGRAPGGVHRLPRPADDGAAHHASGVHQRASRSTRPARASRTTTSTSDATAPRCAPSSAPSATSSTTSRATPRPSPSRGTRA